MDRIKIGIIGCGKQAPKHISGLRGLPGVELVVADIFPQIARGLGEKEGLPCAGTIDELFNDPSVNAVDICTPTPSHAALIKRAIESKKDFFCEKPLCESLHEAREIANLVEQSDLIGMVGYIYRFAPAFEFGKNLFEDTQFTGKSSVLGGVVSAFLRLGGRGGHQLWKHKRDSGGGAINEMLVHMIDLAIWYFGPIRGVNTFTRDILRPKRVIQGKEADVDTEDFVIVNLKMKNGINVVCQADLVTPAFSQFIEVQGEEGSFMASIQDAMPSFLFCEKNTGRYREGRTNLTFERCNLFKAQMAEFVSAVSNRKHPSRCTVRDSLLVMEAIEKVRGEKLI